MDCSIFSQTLLAKGETAIEKFTKLKIELIELTPSYLASHAVINEYNFH